MTYQKSKFIILWIFVGSLICCIVLLFLAKFREILFDDSFISLIEKTLAIYSVHLSVILATGFIDNEKNSNIVHNPLFVTSVVLSLVWNIIIIVRIALFVFGKDDVPLVLNFLDNVPGNSSFIVTGVIAYFFSKG